MGDAAKPFDFDEFASSERDRAPVYSAADLDAARAEARLEALASLAAQEQREQTRLAAQIAETLEKSAAESAAAIAGHIEALTSSARAIVKHVFAAAAEQRTADNAAALIEHYLSADVSKTPATLFIGAETPQPLMDSIVAVLKERAAVGFIAIEPREDIAAGDCRLEWRGGAVAYSREEAFARIDSIFSGVEEESRLSITGKGQPS